MYMTDKHFAVPLTICMASFKYNLKGWGIVLHVLLYLFLTVW